MYAYDICCTITIESLENKSVLIAVIKHVFNLQIDFVYSNVDIFEIRTNKYRTTREELFDGSYKSNVGFAPFVKNEKTVKIKI